ncbi:MAG: hypothetical protein QOJ64_4078 [Acidobacteriota bacterium]|jgi:glycosyltransferase involved in cell wall biosynthesis|nr:hypothetical protein [Acidobacteriota bacterium]
MPKYSLVVPTLDRGHLLEGTLDSLSKLDHDSFEVIISNNSSSDDTEAIARRWTETDPRFKYVKTSKTLCMSDHWDFALRYVTGDYFLYTGDDDSFARHLLRVLDQCLDEDGAEGVYWRQALYYHPSWFEENRAGNLYIPPLSGRKWLIQAKDAIQQMFDLNPPNTFPIGMSFCFKTSIVNSLLEKYGIFFVRPFPDYTSTMMYLPSIRGYLYLDTPLTIVGKSADSNTAAYMNGSQARVQKFFEEHDGPVYPHMPLNYTVIFNGIAECVKAVQAVRSDDLGGYHLDWARYFISIYDAAWIHKETLEDTIDPQEFWQALHKMPTKVQMRVMSYVSRVKVYNLRQRIKHGLAGRPQKNGAGAANLHKGDFCKKVSSLTECSQVLSERNLELGYS